MFSTSPTKAITASLIPEAGLLQSPNAMTFPPRTSHVALIDNNKFNQSNPTMTPAAMPGSHFSTLNASNINLQALMTALVASLVLLTLLNMLMMFRIMTCLGAITNKPTKMKTKTAEIAVQTEEEKSDQTAPLEKTEESGEEAEENKSPADLFLQFTDGLFELTPSEDAETPVDDDNFSYWNHDDLSFMPPLQRVPRHVPEFVHVDSAKYKGIARDYILGDITDQEDAAREAGIEDAVTDEVTTPACELLITPPTPLEAEFGALEARRGNLPGFLPVPSSPDSETDLLELADASSELQDTASLSSALDAFFQTGEEVMTPEDFQRFERILAGISDEEPREASFAEGDEGSADGSDNGSTHVKIVECSNDLLSTINSSSRFPASNQVDRYPRKVYDPIKNQPIWIDEDEFNDIHHADRYPRNFYDPFYHEDQILSADEDKFEQPHDMDSQVNCGLTLPALVEDPSIHDSQVTEDHSEVILFECLIEMGNCFDAVSTNIEPWIHWSPSSPSTEDYDFPGDFDWDSWCMETLEPKCVGAEATDVNPNFSGSFFDFIDPKADEPPVSNEEATDDFDIVLSHPFFGPLYEKDECPFSDEDEAAHWEWVRNLGSQSHNLGALGKDPRKLHFGRKHEATLARSLNNELAFQTLEDLPPIIAPSRVVIKQLDDDIVPDNWDDDVDDGEGSFASSTTPKETLSDKNLRCGFWKSEDPVSNEEARDEFDSIMSHQFFGPLHQEDDCPYTHEEEAAMWDSVRYPEFVDSEPVERFKRKQANWLHLLYPEPSDEDDEPDWRFKCNYRPQSKATRKAHFERKPKATDLPPIIAPSRVVIKQLDDDFAPDTDDDIDDEEGGFASSATPEETLSDKNLTCGFWKPEDSDHASKEAQAKFAEELVFPSPDVFTYDADPMSGHASLKRVRGGLAATTRSHLGKHRITPPTTAHPSKIARTQTDLGNEGQHTPEFAPRGLAATPWKAPERANQQTVEYEPVPTSPDNHGYEHRYFSDWEYTQSPTAIEFDEDALQNAQTLFEELDNDWEQYSKDCQAIFNKICELSDGSEEDSEVGPNTSSDSAASDSPEEVAKAHLQQLRDLEEQRQSIETEPHLQRLRELEEQRHSIESEPVFTHPPVSENARRLAQRFEDARKAILNGEVRGARRTNSLLLAIDHVLDRITPDECEEHCYSSSRYSSSRYSSSSEDDSLSDVDSSIEYGTSSPYDSEPDSDARPHAWFRWARRQSGMSWGTVIEGFKRRLADGTNRTNRRVSKTKAPRSTFLDSDSDDSPAWETCSSDPSHDETSSASSAHSWEEADSEYEDWQDSDTAASDYAFRPPSGEDGYCYDCGFRHMKSKISLNALTTDCALCPFGVYVSSEDERIQTYEDSDALGPESESDSDWEPSSPSGDCSGTSCGDIAAGASPISELALSRRASWEELLNDWAQQVDSLGSSSPTSQENVSTSWASTSETLSSSDNAVSASPSTPASSLPPLDDGYEADSERPKPTSHLGKHRIPTPTTTRLPKIARTHTDLGNEMHLFEPRPKEGEKEWHEIFQDWPF